MPVCCICNTRGKVFLKIFFDKNKKAVSVAPTAS